MWVDMTSREKTLLSEPSSVRPIFKCYRKIRHADWCVGVARWISERETLRCHPVTAALAWYMIRRAYRQLVWAENELAKRKWRDLEGWEEAYEGVKAKRLYLEKILKGGSGPGKRKNNERKNWGCRPCGCPRRSTESQEAWGDTLCCGGL